MGLKLKFNREHIHDLIKLSELYHNPYQFPPDKTRLKISKIAVDCQGNILLSDTEQNQTLKIQPDDEYMERAHQPVLYYLGLHQDKTELSGVYLFCHIKTNSYYPDYSSLTIESWVNSKYFMNLVQQDKVPYLLLQGNLLSELFSQTTRGRKLYRMKNLEPASIAPAELLDLNYQVHLKCPLYLHQSNNVAWMSAVETRVDQSNDGYSYLNMSNLFQNDSFPDLYMHQYTHKFYDTNSLFEQFSPVYALKLLGGVLCDDVGVGKTASVISLIMYQKFKHQCKIIPKLKILGSSNPAIKTQNIKPKLSLKKTISTSIDMSETRNPVSETRNPVSETTEPNKFTDFLKTRQKYHPYFSYPFSSATLIICPRRLIVQWGEEFDKFALTNLNIYRISTLTDFKKYSLQDYQQADVVLISTSFMTNSNYHSKIETDGYLDLSQIYWNRIVLDECHEVLDREARKKAEKDVYHACLKYKSRYKWCLSATPLPHKDQSYESLILFLSNQEESLCQFKDDDLAGAFICHHLPEMVIKDIYSNYFRYNTQDSIKSVATIPRYTITNQFLDFTPIEKAIYDQAYASNSQNLGDQLVQICTNILVSETDSSIIGNQVLTLTEINKIMIRHYEQLKIKYMETITNLEQKKVLDTAEYQTDISKATTPEAKKTITINYKSKIARTDANIFNTKLSIQQTEATIQSFSLLNMDRFKTEQCQICGELFREVVIQPNGHFFCSECVTPLIQHGKYTCPITGDLILKTQIRVMANPHHPNYDASRYVKDNEVNRYGTKMAALISHIRDIVQKDSTSKIIVFSQWDKMLKLVGTVLEYHKIDHVFCQGNVHQMANSMRKFKSSPECKVVLLSAEKSSSGNNLTEADHIVLLDTINHPDWQTIDHQAIGRTVRLGQTKPCVYVTRFIIKNTIEEDNCYRYLGIKSDS